MAMHISAGPKIQIGSQRKLKCHKVKIKDKFAGLLRNYKLNHAGQFTINCKRQINCKIWRGVALC